MTLREFIRLTGNDADLLKALETEKPNGLEAFIGFARKHGYSIDPEEMDDAALSDVTGGHFALTFDTPREQTCRHTGCGGEILHVGDLFHDCVCKTCHETHYWLWSFDYYTE